MKAVIFDLDGVLVDSEGAHFRGLAAVLTGYGCELTHEVYASLLGLAPQDAWGRLRQHYPLSGDAHEFLRRYVRSVEDALRAPQAPKAGAVELIARLRRAGLRLAVASMGAASWVAATLEGLGLAGAFDAVVTSADVACGKPDPDVFLLAARRLGVGPSECLVIEDAPRGIEAARRAGMRCLAVRTPYNTTFDLPAQAVVASLDDVREDLWTAT